MIKRYSKNVDGDFYVEDQCCISCGVPTDIAPDIFKWDDRHCFVKKQPVTADEMTRTFEVIQSADAACIRYGGPDLEILRRIAESGEAEVCDNMQSRQFEQKFRSIVRVSFPAKTSEAFIQALCTEARMLKGYQGKPRYRFKPLHKIGVEAVLKFSWFEDKFHTVAASPDGSGVFILRLAAYPPAWQGVYRTVHGWLKSLPEAHDIWWMDQEEFRLGGGQPAPY